MNEKQFVVMLGELAEGLVRIPLALMGRFVKGAQRFAITPKDIAEAVENFRKRVNGELVIDYEHASEHPEWAQGQPIPAAGWLRSVEDQPDEKGVLWGLAEFSERARGLIQAGEYKYLSPVIAWTARDKQTGVPQGCTLLSMALTNRPFFDAMPAIQLSDDGWVVEAATEADERKGKPMKVTLTDRASCKVSVVMDDGSQHEVSVEGLQPEPKVVQLSDVARTSDGRYNFAGIETGAGVLIAGEVVHAMHVQGELDEAVKAGKITPAQRPTFEKLALSDLGGFREIVKTMPVQVELGERGFAGDGTERRGDAKQVDARLEQLTREKMAADKSLSYGHAFRIVLSEHEDLRQARLAAMRE